MLALSLGLLASAGDAVARPSPSSFLLPTASLGAPVKPVLPIVLVLLAAPAGSPTVKVTFDQDTDFSHFKTYDWVATQEPVSNPVNHIRMTRAIERELEAKGLKKAMENPDLRVTYLAKVEKKIRGTGYQVDSPWQA